MVHRSAVPAIAQRIKALEEVSAETDCVLNFDLDTLFLGSVVPLLEEITSKYKTGIFGVSERENRNRWMKQMNLKEVVNTPDLCATRLTAKDCIRNLSPNWKSMAPSCTARSRIL